MKVFRKILTVIIITVMVTAVLAGNSKKATSIINNSQAQQPVQVGYFSRDLSDDYIQFVRQGLEEIQKQNEGKVNFTYYDAKFSQAAQNEQIDKSLNGGVDLIMIDIAETSATQDVINRIKQSNIPVIMFNREPLTMEPIKSYTKALFVGLNSQQAGTIQGEILVNAWNSNKASVDRDIDNTMDYIMLMGERNNRVPIERTKYSVLTIQQAGIETDELALRVCDWSTEIAQSTTETLLLKYGDRIEAVIANDDSMAIGAVQALQKYGYNKGGNSKTIPVVGVDGIPEAIDLINKGMMLGTAVHNPRDMSEALYTIGMNLVSNIAPLEGTQYKFDDSGVAIRLSYTKYVKTS
jgi:methyl-galactoside transport system substrate-binding protein